MNPAIGDEKRELAAFGKVAAEPFPDTHVKTNLVGEGKFGVAKINNTKTELVKLKVVVDSGIKGPTNELVYLTPDEVVYVRASDYVLPWAKDVFELDGKKFILVPADRVELVG